MKILPLLAALLLAPAVFGQETPPTTPATPPKEKPAKFSLSAYKAPKSAGTIERKDGDGASRALITLPNGTKIQLPNLYLLLPKQGTALTTKAQPSLFTFQTAMSPVEYRLTITRPNQPEAAFIYAVSRTAAGIHRVDLSEFAVTLDPNVEYRWTVVFRPDPASTSNDLEAHGSIMRIEPDVALAGKIKAAAPWELPSIYSEAGIWYDTLASLSDLIESNPQDKDYVTARENLLKQVDLNAAAAAKQK